jgi:predicted NAD/FAD-binding protein
LNRLQGHHSDKPILETLNPTIAIDPAKVLDRMTYHHPVYGVRAIAAQSRYSEINGQRGTRIASEEVSYDSPVPA